MEHYKKKHPEDTPPPPEVFTLYDAKLLAERLIDREITMADATDEADASIRKNVRRTTV